MPPRPSATAGLPYHSARRLIRALARMDSEAAGMHTDAVLLEVVAAAGGLDPRNPQVLGQAQAILELPRRVLRELDLLDDDRVPAVRGGMRVVVDALTLSELQRPWREIAMEIGDAGHAAVATASLLLDQGSAERPLNEDELHRLAGEIRDILEEVRMNPSVPGDLRQYTETSLVAILRAIDDYWLRGSAVLETAIDSAIGRAYRHRDAIPTSPTWRRIGKVLAQVAVVVAFANDATSLPETVGDVVEAVTGTSSSAPAAPAIPPTIPPAGPGPVGS